MILKKKSTYLISREKKFNDLCDNFNHEKITNLVVAHKISKKLFNRLTKISKNYLKKCREYKFCNMTPNGKLMPKKEIENEVNDMVKIFRDIILSLNLDHKIRNWVIPAIRYKTGKINHDNKNRSSRSELPHSDTWAGWDENSILLQIPLLGDVKNNIVNFFEMPVNFSKKWMKKMKFNSGIKLASQCKEINHHYKLGYIYIADISVVHKTKRNFKSKSRLSIDIPIILNSKKKKIAYNFRNNLISKNKIKLLGKKYRIECNTKMSQIKETDNGIKFKKMN